MPSSREDPAAYRLLETPSSSPNLVFLVRSYKLLFGFGIVLTLVGGITALVGYEEPTLQGGSLASRVINGNIRAIGLVLIAIGMTFVTVSSFLYCVVRDMTKKERRERSEKQQVVPTDIYYQLLETLPPGSLYNGNPKKCLLYDTP